MLGLTRYDREALAKAILELVRENLPALKAKLAG